MHLNEHFMLFFLNHLLIIVNMDLFNEGQKLTLFIKKDSSIVEMTCSIETVFEDRLNIALPQYFMRYIAFLQVGQHLTAKVFSKMGTIDFNTMIINSPLEDHFTIELDYNSIKLTPSEEQPVIKAVDYLDIYRDEEVLRAKTFEISTEFLRFVSNKTFIIGESLNGVLILPKNYGIIKFKATITEIDPIYDNEFTAEFVTLSEEARQNLLYYMYMYVNDID